MVLSSITALEKQRQQVPFALFQVCTRSTDEVDPVGQQSGL